MSLIDLDRIAYIAQQKSGITQLIQKVTAVFPLSTPAEQVVIKELGTKLESLKVENAAVIKVYYDNLKSSSASLEEIVSIFLFLILFLIFFLGKYDRNTSYKPKFILDECL